MKKAVVIIPTYNESKNIPRVVPALMAVFEKIKNWDMHILVVDDNSPDKTYEVVKTLQRQHPNLHLLINQKKSGLGGAYLKGMDEAFNNLSADVIFEFDADLSHDPLKIPDFLSQIDQGSDIVLGSRYIAGGSIPDDWGIDRKFLSVVGNIVIMIVLTDFRIRDWTTGYRAISKQVYEAVADEMHDNRFTGYTFQIGFLHKAVRKGFKISEVPIHFIDRTEGVSKLGSEYIKNTLLYILKARFQEIINNRIFKFAMVGGLGSIVQLSALTFIRKMVFYDLAFFLAIELAVVSNFLLNNIWTFADKKLSLKQFPSKFAQFNLASAGSIIIQQIIGSGGKLLIGADHLLFTLPLINFKVDTGLIFAITGIAIGMFWNFFAYTKFIWKKNN